MNERTMWGQTNTAGYKDLYATHLDQKPADRNPNEILNSRHTFHSFGGYSAPYQTTLGNQPQAQNKTLKPETRCHCVNHMHIIASPGKV